jgi:hypothetical protein
VNLTINTFNNCAAYKDELKNPIPGSIPLATSVFASSSLNIYKYIAFDQCREINNVPICDYAKANLSTTLNNMKISDDTIEAFITSFNRAHFVRLLYAFQNSGTSAAAGTFNKLSIYANTTFNYKNYNSANPTTPFTPNNNVFSDEPPHTVIIKYEKQPPPPLPL